MTQKPLSKQHQETFLSATKQGGLSTRAVAIGVLLDWQSSKAPIDGFFNKAVATLSPQDTGFIKTIVYGVLRQKQYLDFIIEQCAKRPLKKLDPGVLITLEVGVYQLLFLDRVPPSAAVNETVNTLKKAGLHKGVTGFVNGVLRNVDRQRDRFPSPEQTVKNGNPVLNHPQWLTDKWRKQFGKDQAFSICYQNNVEPILTLRVNTKVTSRDELLNTLHKHNIAAQPSSHSPVGISLPEWTGPIIALPEYTKGAFQVQDESAQLAALLLYPLDTNNLRVLDGCAGLGGKTSHFAQYLGSGARLVAVEPEQRRFQLLKENLDRLGLHQQVGAINSTLEAFNATRPEGFDRIFLDVPCSGTGVIRRHPDIRWNRRPGDFKQLRQTQESLLATGANLLNPGGLLVYATCSIELEENEQVIQQFLADHPTWKAIDARTVLPPSAHKLVNDSGFFNPLPAATHDGFFAALIKRSASL